MQVRSRSGVAPGRRRDARAATAWSLLLALLAGAVCAPVGAGARALPTAPPCGVAEGPAGVRVAGASARPARPGPEREAPVAACVRHCRSAAHALQTPSPKAPLSPASLQAAALPTTGPVLARQPASMPSRPGALGVPARASPRPILHCSLLL